MDTLITLFQYMSLIWAASRVIELLIELLSFWGGDGVQPYDIMWWLCRPFSIRCFSIVRFPMLIGLVIWICLIWAASWSFSAIIL